MSSGIGWQKCRYRAGGGMAVLGFPPSLPKNATEQKLGPNQPPPPTDRDGGNPATSIPAYKRPQRRGSWVSTSVNVERTGMARIPVLRGCRHGDAGISSQPTIHYHTCRGFPLPFSRKASRTACSSARVPTGLFKRRTRLPSGMCSLGVSGGSSARHSTSTPRR